MRIFPIRIFRRYKTQSVFYTLVVRLLLFALDRNANNKQSIPALLLNNPLLPLLLLPQLLQPQLLQPQELQPQLLQPLLLQPHELLL